MDDLDADREIPFCVKVGEWDNWSERFLAKATRCGFKDFLIRKLSISKMDEDIDETASFEKKKSIIIELIEIAHTEFIFLIDVETCNDKVDFNMIKGCKTKD
jgi:hypothetical protein